MNDSEFISLAIVVIAILGGAWMTNLRLGDLDGRFTALGHRIDDVRDVIRAEMRANRAEARGELRSKSDR